MIKLQGERAFSADLNAFAAKLGVQRQTVYQSVALEIWNGVTKRTPVDTGRARSSWNLSIGSPDPSIPPEREGGKGAHKNKRQPPTNPPAPTPDYSKVTGDQVVFITSNLPYIEALENGSSKQAPVGMVMITVAEVVARIQLILEGMKE